MSEFSHWDFWWKAGCVLWHLLLEILSLYIDSFELSLSGKLPVRKCVQSYRAAKDQCFLEKKKNGPSGHVRNRACNVRSVLIRARIQSCREIRWCWCCNTESVFLNWGMQLILMPFWKQFEREHFKVNWRCFVFKVASQVEMPLVLMYGKFPAGFTLLP